MKISVVVPVKEISDYLERETIPSLLKQSHQNFEIIVLPDKAVGKKFLKTKIVSTWPIVGPADKKDIGAKKAKGEIIAFIDDDAYPDKDWLKNAIGYFVNSEIAAVCGPGLTPPDDSFLAKVSGWFWSSPMGSGAAGQYRNWPMVSREVDDYPTFNLIVRKADFERVGGFDSQFWPGEDTKFCLDIVYRLKKKIIYDPKIFVYHHRRKIFKDNLKQIGRYGLHRGYFAKVLPKTSRRLGYFMPLFFIFWTIGGIFLLFFLKKIIGNGYLIKEIILFYFLTIIFYFFLLILNSFWVWRKSKNLLIAILLVPTIFISHFFYGLMFLRGLLKRDLKSKYSRNEIL